MRRNIINILIFLLILCTLGGCGFGAAGVALEFEKAVKKGDMNKDCLAETGLECFVMQDYASSLLYDEGYLFIGGNCRIIRFDIARSQAEVIGESKTRCKNKRKRKTEPGHRISGIAKVRHFFYITDSSNHQILRLNLTNGQIFAIAGSTSGKRDGQIAQALFSKPAEIETDGFNLYVNDFGNNSIRRINLASGLASTLAGNADPGHKDGIGVKAQFQAIMSMTFMDSFLYVLDNHTLRKVNVGNGLVSTLIDNKAGLFISYKDGSFDSASLKSPRHITNDGQSLYITDSYRIRKIDLKSKIVSTIAGDSWPGFRNKNFGVSSVVPYGLPGENGKDMEHETKEAQFSFLGSMTFGDSVIYALDSFDFLSYIRKIDLYKDQVSVLSGKWKK